MSAGAIRFTREEAERLRPAAQAFGHQVLRGARGLLLRAPGGISFASPAVQEAHLELREALSAELRGERETLLVAASGKPLSGFLDRLVLAWLKAEPALGEFLLADPRATPAFVFDLLRAELSEIGIAFSLEPGEEGYRLLSPTSRRQVVLPAIGSVWVGLGLGFMAEMWGLGGGTTLGFFLGLGFGLAVGVMISLRPPRASCSECGAPAGASDASCARCGTRFVGSMPGGLDLPGDAGEAPGEK